MKIFISWSGEPSRDVAHFLCDWLPDVIQVTRPWISDEIPPGKPWFDVLGKKLADADFCIACLTPDNLGSQWVLFESGALASKLGKGRLCPYLIHLTPNELRGHPLHHYQAVEATQQDTWKMLQAINKALPKEHALAAKRLERAFDQHWPALEKRLSKLPGPDFHKLDDTPVLIVNRESGMCIEVADGSTEDRATVRVGAFAGAPHQLWYVRDAGVDGAFWFMARHSGKCLDVEGKSAQEGTKIHQWAYWRGPNQLWRIEHQAGHYYKLFAKHSGLLLSVAADQTSIVQSSWIDTDKQRWFIRLLGM